MERADQVVVLLAGLVVEERLALRGLVDQRGGQGADPGGRRRERGGHLEDVQGGPGVAVGQPRDGGEDRVVGLDVERAQAALGVGQRPAEDRGHLRLGQPLEDVDAAAGEERRDDLEGRVLGGGPDQDDGAALHVGEEGVLLRLVEAVDLVDEEDGARAVQAQPLIGFPDDRADLLHPGEDGGEAHEVGAGALGRSARRAWSSRCPGGPHRIIEWRSPFSIAVRSSRPSPRRCAWPTNSSRLRGRMRSASGAASRRAWRLACSNSSTVGFTRCRSHYTGRWPASAARCAGSARRSWITTRGTTARRSSSSGPIR